MTDGVENLILEHLKRFQAPLDRVERKISDYPVCAANLENGQASIIQRLGHLAAADAMQPLAIDHVNDRLDRIERRLELAS